MYLTMLRNAMIKKAIQTVLPMGMYVRLVSKAVQKSVLRGFLVFGIYAKTLIFTKVIRIRKTISYQIAALVSQLKIQRMRFLVVSRLMALSLLLALPAISSLGWVMACKPKPKPPQTNTTSVEKNPQNSQLEIVTEILNPVNLSRIFKRDTKDMAKTKGLFQKPPALPLPNISTQDFISQSKPRPLTLDRWTLMLGGSAAFPSNLGLLGNSLQMRVTGEFSLQNIFDRLSLGLMLYTELGSAQKSADSIIINHHSLDFSRVKSIGTLGYGAGLSVSYPFLIKSLGSSIAPEVSGNYGYGQYFVSGKNFASAGIWSVGAGFRYSLSRSIFLRARYAFRGQSFLSIADGKNKIDLAGQLSQTQQEISLHIGYHF